MERDELRATTVFDETAPRLSDPVGTTTVRVGFGAAGSTQSVTLLISARTASFGEFAGGSASPSPDTWATTIDGIEFHVLEEVGGFARTPTEKSTQLWWTRDGYRFGAVGYGTDESQTEAMLQMATSLTPVIATTAATAYDALVGRWLDQSVTAQVTSTDGTVSRGAALVPVPITPWSCVPSEMAVPTVSNSDLGR